MDKKTKIVATISDIRCDVEFIKELYDAGMNVVRMNTAHQTIEATRELVKNVRSVSDSIAIMVDTKGPEIRTTKSEVKLEVEAEQKIIVKGSKTEVTTSDILYVNHENFVKEVKVGSHILIDDGDIELSADKKVDDYLECTVNNSGTIKGKKSVNVPNGSFSLPALTEKDKEYVKLAIELDLDFIAHSFVRNQQDVKEIQDMLDAANSRVKIIAKIENQEGVDNIDDILEVVYGVMVARGDLAIEVPYEKIPGVQKRLINKCIEVRKPVIIATQMLHSMIDNPRPTRAEVTDIANAIYSKTDAIMLSGETTYGKYPVKAVKTMAKIAKEVEISRGDYHKTPISILSSKTSAYLAKSVVEASIKLDAKVVIADTTTGRTLRNVAGFRGRKPVYAQCYDRRVVRELGLSFGIFPKFLDPKLSSDFVGRSIEQLKDLEHLEDEDIIVVIGGDYGVNHGSSFIEVSNVKNIFDRHNK